MLRMLIRPPTRAPEHAPSRDTGPRLYTLGYQGYSQPAFIRALTSKAVTILCDVRRHAMSRKPGFSRLALAEACTRVGIRYAHFWQLGVPAERRRGAGSRNDRALLLEDYRIRMLPNQQPTLAQIHEWLRQGERVALTCFERDPAACHRSCVTEALHRQFGEPCSPTHL